MKKLKYSKSSREKMVIRTSLISILTNFVLVGLKLIIGFFSNSIAIISDAINNSSDAMSNVVTIIGAKLSSKPPDKNHPYGYGRAEYLSALAVSIIVLYAGLLALIESAKKIISPEPVNYNIPAILIVTVSVIIKLLLGFHVRKKGREINSVSLAASGLDALNDALLSASVLVSILIYLIFDINIEAYISAILALFIIKTGLQLIKESVNNMLGTRVETKLSTSIKKEIKKIDGVEGVFDLVLNNYGPDEYLGSVHIEVADTMTVARVDQISREITKRIQKKYGILLHTIGIYSVNTTDKEAIKIRNKITSEIVSIEGITKIHGFYLNDTEKTIAFDVVIDFGVKDRRKIYREVYDKTQSLFPGYKLNITQDIDFDS